MSNAVKVEVPYLVEGMFVSELDIPWEKSGFIMQGFLADEKNIHILREKCEWVIVLKSHSKVGIFKDVKSRRLVTRVDRPHDFPQATQNRDPFLVHVLKVFKLDFILKLFKHVFGPDAANQPRQLNYVKSDANKGASANKNELAEIVITKQDAVIQARALRARGVFVDDELVTLDVVKHVATTNLSDEYMSAQLAKQKLAEAVGSALFTDALNSDAMNIVLNETKESVGDIVESMLRNPDAMRLVGDIKSHDDWSYKHAVDICILMIAFGREMQLPKVTLIELGLGGLLHDVGEVKPTEDKQVRVRNIAMFKIYQSHVLDGMAIIHNTTYSDIVKSIVVEHHERYDGSGYPYGLSNTFKEDDEADQQLMERKARISMYGLMIAIVDTYVSMVAGRNCKNAIAPSVAMSYITRRAGKDFDPILCDVFSQVIGVYPVGVYVELSTGEVAVVTKQNRVWRLKPVVLVVLDVMRNNIEPFSVDLSSANDGRTIKKEVLMEAAALRNAAT